MNADDKLRTNLEVEEALVGSVLVDPAYLESPTVGNVAPGDFYLVTLQKIWSAILELRDEGKEIDYLTVEDRLRNEDIGRGELAGGAYLSSLLVAAPTVMHAEDYARIVTEHSARRRLLGVAGQIAKLADLPVNGTGPRGPFTDAEAILKEAMQGVAAKPRQRYTAAELAGLEVPWVRYVLDGLVVDGGLTLLAGESGAGKSWLALDLALAVAAWEAQAWGRAAEGGSVLFFAADNSIRSTHHRVVDLCKGRDILPPDDTLTFDFDPLKLSAPAGPATIADAISQSKARLVVLDAIVRYMGEGDENSAGDVGAIMASLREIANRTGTAFLIVHHLRKVYGDSRTRAKLADRVRGSGDFIGSVDSALVVTAKGQGPNQVRTLAQVKNRDDEEANALTFDIMPGPKQGLILAFEQAGALTAVATKAETAAALMADAIRGEPDNQFSRKDLVALVESHGMSLPSRTADRTWKELALIHDIETLRVNRRIEYRLTPPRMPLEDD